MDLRNCKRCGKIFAYTVKPICHNCIQQEEEDFSTVRSYLKEHPGSTVKKISKETNVSSKQIIKFFQEGRLEVTDGMSPLIECEKCGTPIFAGRFCSACTNDLYDQFQSVSKTNQSAGGSGDNGSKAGMHLSKFER